MSGMNNLKGMLMQPLAAMCLLGSTLSVWAADMPTVEFASIAKADLGKGWGEPQQDGAISYRVAEAAGKPNAFYVKAWWKQEALRPPEGSAFILELKFKDTLKSPAWFYANGAWGGGYGSSEVHRFGGTGDGKWKTASIPITWEYLCRQLRPTRPWQHRPDAALFSIKSTEPVPVASLTPRALKAGDRERYFEEIRTFNALEQTEARQQTPYPSSVGPIEGEARTAVPFHWDRPDSLLPNFKPTADLLKAPIKIRMCLNEIQPAAFGVFANGLKLEGVQYSVSDLKSEQGTLKAKLTCRTAEYTLLRRKKNIFWLPQRLWPAYAVDIPEGRSHFFVANIETLRGQTLPGTYKGQITITHKQGTQTIPLEVEVMGVDLLTMDEAGLQFGGCNRGLSPMSDVKFQVEYNQTITNLWYDGVAPYILGVNKDGTLDLDYTYINEWMTRAKINGMQKVVYFLGGGPTKFPTTISLGAALGSITRETKGGHETWKKKLKWFKEQGSQKNRNKMLPNTRILYKQWVKQVVAYSRKHNWPELILTPFDEPATWTRKRITKREGSIGSGPWIRSYFKDACAAIHEADPKVRIYASIHDLRGKSGICFLPDVEVFCTNAIMQDEKAPEKVREAGKASAADGGRPKEWWQYSFTGGSRPEYIRYTMGYFFGHYDARGGLIWAYNWEQGWNSMESKWRYAWQTPLGIIPGNFFEGVREGLDDRRILETYKKSFKEDPKAMKELTQLLSEARQARGNSGTSRVTDFWTGITNPLLMEKWRNRLLDRLAGKEPALLTTTEGTK